MVWHLRSRIPLFLAQPNSRYTQPRCECVAVIVESGNYAMFFYMRFLNITDERELIYKAIFKIDTRHVNLYKDHVKKNCYPRRNYASIIYS